MAIIVRDMWTADARAFLEVHHAAVRGLATKDYPQQIIDDWAPLPITGYDIGLLLNNPDGELRLIAELDGTIAGIGALVLASNELRACYVVPGAVRHGVGSALVAHIERLAREDGLLHLHVESSLTAEPFYRALGYVVRERGEHTRASGLRMPCVKMHKSLV